MLYIIHDLETASYRETCVLKLAIIDGELTSCTF